MKIYCYADGSDYMCEYGSETYIIGEVHGTRLVAFAPLDFLQEEYPDAGITQEVIQAAIEFAVGEGYIAESYPEE
jgi:hypothetical protein